jgi:hypothetical protein
MGIPHPNADELSNTFVRDKGAAVIDSHGDFQATHLWHVSSQLGVMLPVVNLVDKPNVSSDPVDGVGFNMSVMGLFR